MACSFIFASLLAAVSAGAAPEPHSVSEYITSAIDTAANITTSAVEPCLQISTQQAAGNTNFRPEMALQCLQSVPLHAQDGQIQLQGLKELVQFQSTLAYLKDPPPGYLMPAVDIEGGIDLISDQLEAGFYTNEYDFQLDIRRLIAAAYDGHFNYLPDITQVFTFVRLDGRASTNRFQIISVSQDGTTLPEVYDWLDLPNLFTGNLTADYTPSPIRQINGEDVEQALNTYAAIIGTSQDPDANYNTLFPNFAGNVSPSPQPVPVGNWAFSFFPLSNNTEITFANGTVASFSNAATAAGSDFSNVTDGSSFFDAFCSGNILQEAQSPPDSSSNLSNATNTTTPIQSQVPYTPIPTGEATIIPVGFPTPLAIAGDASIAGYLPDSRSDLAVVSLPNYAPGALYTFDFEDVLRETLATAKSLGKTKLIIDLRGNPGGTVLFATDTFKQLFPNDPPISQHNIRATPAYDWAGQVATEQFANVTTANATEALANAGFASQLMVNAPEITGADGSHFTTWEEWYQPHHIHNDNFTSLFVTNFSDWWQTAPFPVYGFYNDTAPQPQTFSASNIVLLQDGYCASTCTIFAEMMKNIEGVKTVVVGGRKQLGPMQGVGGVKGSSSQGMYVLWSSIQGALAVATDDQINSFTAALDNGVPGSWSNSTAHALSRAAPSDETKVQAGVNWQNNIRPGDETVTPLHFVYEAADCRFFYTPNMYVYQEAVWDMAYDLMWGNGTCVSGSTGQPSAGNITGVGELALPPVNVFGANDTIFPSGDLGSAVSSGQSAASSTSLVRSSSTTVAPNAATSSAPKSASASSSTSNSASGSGSAPSATASVKPQTTNAAGHDVASITVGLVAAMAVVVVAII